MKNIKKYKLFENKEDNFKYDLINTFQYAIDLGEKYEIKNTYYSKNDDEFGDFYISNLDDEDIKEALILKIKTKFEYPYTLYNIKDMSLYKELIEEIEVAVKRFKSMYEENGFRLFVQSLDSIEITFSK